MKSHLFPGLLYTAVTAPAFAQTPPDGAQLFALNCAACHQLDTAVVGPSLAEIRSIYLERPDDFVKWAVAPGKKRPGAIEMPSMVHLGEPALRAIYHHVMIVSKGAKAQKVATVDPFIKSPTLTARPLVQRIFLPNCGPAGIAIALDEKISLAWDAGACRLRYAWTGGFIDGYPYWAGKGSSLAKISGKVRYTQPFPFFSNRPPIFRGYSIVKGLPVFSYEAEPQSAGTGTGLYYEKDPFWHITESFAPLPSGAGFQQSFTLSPEPKKEIKLTFPTDSETKTTSDVGTWDKNILTLTPDQATKFTLTHTFP